MQSLSKFNLSSHSPGLEQVPLYLSSILFLFVLKLILDAFYNVYLHPLRKLPGPKLTAATGLVFAYMCIAGDEARWTCQMHEKYGEVVRLAPDRVSYTNPQAWKDIYGHRFGGRLENSKDPRFSTKDVNGEDSVLSVLDSEEHGRIRKIFTNAFSDKALRLQEPLIRGYVSKLIGNINRAISTDPDLYLNAVRLFNYTTFDIMSDLTFGEPLGMLDTSEYTPWVKAIFGAVKFASFARIVQEYSWLGYVLQAVQPKSLAKLRQSHFDHSAERVDRRLQKGLDIGKPDIWKLVLIKNKDQLTVPQMHTNASLFMAAGTETTATLLSGLTFFLLKNPEKMQRLVEEVRSISKEDLSLEMLPRLQYLNACFEEALRCYPPVPSGIPRRVAQGGNVICGEWIPGGTRANVPQYAAFTSATNFKNPKSFVPERWLPDTGYDSDKKDVVQPFSYGPRNCLGKNLAYHEMRIIFATVLWHFDLELSPESGSWSDQKMHILWDKPELMVRFKAIR